MAPNDGDVTVVATKGVATVDSEGSDQHGGRDAQHGNKAQDCKDQQQCGPTTDWSRPARRSRGPARRLSNRMKG